MSTKNRLQVFEHQVLRVKDTLDGIKFTPLHLKTLHDYFGSGCPYFSLVHNGVKFNEYVGVLQVGNLTIEVIPKTDKSVNNKSNWHSFLISMLRTVGFLNVHDTGFSSLRTKSNSILELYFELFLNEVKYLMQSGLIKKYRIQEYQSFALKGKLLFQKNIQKNLVHEERFYVRHTIYDQDNLHNQLLYKTLLLIKRLQNSSTLSSDVNSLLLNFPECSHIQISKELFETIPFNRKTESYRKAIGIAKMLLLNYYPDIRSGNNNILALMFDMNKLWESYVYKLLKKKLAGRFLVREKIGKEFWKPDGGRISKVYPDIVVYDNDGGKVITVLDTKWKNINGSKPSDDDLKQMLVYNLYCQSLHSALLYPSTNQTSSKGNYLNSDHGGCSLLFLKIEEIAGNYRLDLQNIVEWIEERRTYSIKTPLQLNHK